MIVNHIIIIVIRHSFNVPVLDINSLKYEEVTKKIDLYRSPYIQQMTQSPTSNCDICVQAPGAYNCRQFRQYCRQYFCEMCKNAHLRLNISKKHTLLKSKEPFMEDKVICEHTEKHTFLGVDCNVPLGKVCLVNDHNGHIMKDLDKGRK